MSANRLYDIVVFGATGYTGKLTAEYITTSLPTDLRWALAGRSVAKLEAVAEEVKGFNPDRIQPSIEVCNLDDAELDALAKKTKLIINTVGPYCLYGEHTFRACAENGTHYLDVTGEVPYVADMIKKYEKKAQATGAIMIPQIGLESAPADLITLALVNMIRQRFSAPTKEVVISMQLSATPSGGTLNTVFSLMDVYNFKQMQEANAPYALSPVPAPKVQSSNSWVTKLFGVRVLPDLGILTSSFGGMADLPTIHRSWGLLGGPENYGPNFQVHEFAKAGNYFSAVLLHFGLMLGGALLAVPLIRTVARKFVYAPGDGPTKEEMKKESVEYRAVGFPDTREPTKARAYCKAYYKGGIYRLTGILLAEAASTILRDDHKLSGGVYTPACLGENFISRLEPHGLKFERKFYEE